MHADVVYTPALLGLFKVEARKRASDHAPVWLGPDATSAPQVLRSWIPSGATPNASENQTVASN